MTIGMMMLAVANGGNSITLAGSYNPSSTVSGTPAVCQFELTNGGDIRLTNPTNVVNDVGDWIVPKNSFSSYDAMMTVNSGSALTGAATATWLNLGTTRNWQLVQSVIGTATSSCTLQIRNATSLAVLGSASVTFTAERT